MPVEDNIAPVRRSKNDGWNKDSRAALDEIVSPNRRPPTGNETHVTAITIMRVGEWTVCGNLERAG